jgi:hypothetical protein
LAEKGYYVLPVAVIDQFLKENGLPTPARQLENPILIFFSLYSLIFLGTLKHAVNQYA